MPFWPRDVEKKMAESKKAKHYLKKSYWRRFSVLKKYEDWPNCSKDNHKDNAMAKLEKTRNGRQNKSSNKKQQGSEDTTVVVNQSSDSSEQESEGENIIVQRSHKRIVKKWHNNLYTPWCAEESIIGFLQHQKPAFCYCYVKHIKNFDLCLWEVIPVQ